MSGNLGELTRAPPHGISTALNDIARVRYQRVAPRFDEGKSQGQGRSCISVRRWIDRPKQHYGSPSSSWPPISFGSTSTARSTTPAILSAVAAVVTAATRRGRLIKNRHS